MSFGNVAQRGLSEQFVLNDLTVVGSLAGGGDLGSVDLIYVPEPSAVLLVIIGLASLAWRRTNTALHSMFRVEDIVRRAGVHVARSFPGLAKLK